MATQKKALKKEDRDFLVFLEETLIPDLHESGHQYTAEDFERCVEIITRLADDLEDCMDKERGKSSRSGKR